MIAPTIIEVNRGFIVLLLLLNVLNWNCLKIIASYLCHDTQNRIELDESYVIGTDSGHTYNTTTQVLALLTNHRREGLSPNGRFFTPELAYEYRIPVTERTTAHERKVDLSIVVVMLLLVLCLCDPLFLPLCSMVWRPVFWAPRFWFQRISLQQVHDSL